MRPHATSPRSPAPTTFPPREDRDRIRRQLDWEVALEVTERARRRFSLEQEGVVVVTIDELDQLAAKVSETGRLTPSATRGCVRSCAAVADVMRYGRAGRIGCCARPAGAGPQPRHPHRRLRGHLDPGLRQQEVPQPEDGIDIRAWTDPKHTTRLTELFGRVLAKKPTEVVEPVEARARLDAIGLLTEHKVSGRNRWMLDHKRLLS